MGQQRITRVFAGAAAALVASLFLGRGRKWPGDEADRHEEAEAELRATVSRLEALVENLQVGVLVEDGSRRISYVNGEFCRMFGLPISPEALIGLDCSRYAEKVKGRFVEPEAFVRRIEELIRGRSLYVVEELSLADGRTFERDYVPIFGGGEHLGNLWQFRDVTERKKAEEALQGSEARFRQLFEHSVDALFVHDEKGRFVDCNSEACRSLGYTREELLKLSVEDVVTDLLTEEEKRLLGGETLWEKALNAEPGATVDFHQNRHRRKDGTTFPVELGIGSMDYAGQRLLFVSARDTTRRSELEKRLAHQAFHDPLTGLPNRTLFLDRLGHALAAANRREGSVAVLFLDLDDFKLVNDSLGHAAGDDLLVAAARRLTACLRAGDTVARLGGDEFTVLLEDVTDEAEVERVVVRLLDVFATPLRAGGSEVSVSASIGVVPKVPPGSEPEDLLRRADLAMYRAKENGKARYEVFEEAMRGYATARLGLERDLRRVVKDSEESPGGEEFEVHYQPKVLLAGPRTGEVAGVEALVRWRCPRRGLVPPDVFLPVAEETDLIARVDTLVLREACRQAKTWRDAQRDTRGDAHCPDALLPFVSVNVSARRFRQPGFARDVAGVLAETGLDPGGLVLEVSERVAMHDAELSVRRLEEIKALGVGLALDGFGTGHSSLSALKRFPMDYLEIDRSFVDGLGEVLDDTVLVSGALGLARSLGLRAVAGGIETAEQLAQLQALGCDLGQGYHLSKPLPAGEIGPLLTGPAPYPYSVSVQPQHSPPQHSLPA